MERKVDAPVTGLAQRHFLHVVRRANQRLGKIKGLSNWGLVTGGVVFVAVRRISEDLR
jgi:hypothetical protein